MTTLALAPSRPATINPWVVAAAVVIPTFMEVLDTTIANVALRYIAGRAVGGGDRQRVGDHELSRRQRDDPADRRAGSRHAWAGAIISCCRSRSSRSPRVCAGWRPA